MTIPLLVFFIIFLPGALVQFKWCNWEEALKIFTLIILILVGLYLTTIFWFVTLTALMVYAGGKFCDGSSRRKS